MPAIPEQSVVGPVGRRGAHRDHGQVVNQEHDQCKDGQTQPAVGHNAVDLVRNGKLPGALFLVAALDDLGDIDIALTGDDALSIVVQFGLGCLDVLFDMPHHVSGNFQLLKHLVVALKNLDRIPTLLILGQVVYSRLLDVGNGVLNGTREGMHRHGLGILGSVDSGLGGLHDAGALQSGDLHNLATQLTGQLAYVDLIAVLLDDIHHVDGDDHRNAKFGQLRGQVKVTL